MEYLFEKGHLGTTNLAGTLPANDPLFVMPIDPASAPTTGGDLRLRATSPAIDAGDSALNTVLTDLAGNPRIRGEAIDLGAYEMLSNVKRSMPAAGTGAGRPTR